MGLGERRTGDAWPDPLAVRVAVPGALELAEPGPEPEGTPSPTVPGRAMGATGRVMGPMGPTSLTDARRPEPGARFVAGGGEPMSEPCGPFGGGPIGVGGPSWRLNDGWSRGKVRSKGRPGV